MRQQEYLAVKTEIMKAEKALMDLRYFFLIKRGYSVYNKIFDCLPDYEGFEAAMKELDIMFEDVA